MRISSGLRLAVLGTGLALALAACSSSSPSSSPSATTVVQSGPATSSSPPAAASTSPSAATTPSATTPSPTTASLSPAQTLAAVELTKKDLNAGFLVKPTKNGDVVDGQVTLDNCGYAFTTESHRVARVQLGVFTTKNEDTGIENEVVVYDSPAQATLALVQWRASFKRCHKGVYWTPRDKSTPALDYLSFSSSRVPSLPVSDNVVSSFVATAKGITQRIYLTGIFQRHGAVLDAVYYQTFAPQTKPDLTAVSTLAVLSGKRLSAL